MEGQVWKIVQAVVSVAEPVSARFSYTSEEILLVALWAILHDRPMVWACEAGHWPRWCRPRQLPHPSTLSRRWRSSVVQREAERVHEELVRRFGIIDRYAAIDGRCLLVGGYSKDPEARSGRAAGGMGKGYKLHALVDGRHVITAYEVASLPVAEQKMAVLLLRKAPASIARVVGDTNYDSMNLHRVAAETGRRLYTPLREKRVGRRRQARRLQLLRLAQRRVGCRLLAWRDGVERAFGHSSCIGFGYKGLPSWARRLHRVRRWMWGKTLLYNAWLLYKQRAA